MNVFAKIFVILVLANVGLATDVEGSQFLPANSFNNCDLKNCKMQEEIWKDVVEYEGLYQVSNIGSVRTVKTSLIRTLTLNQYGYYTLVLYKSNIGIRYLAHRLKAIAFIPNPDNKRTVNHRDGIKTNNGYHNDGGDNLEWATYSENALHAFKIGLRKPAHPMLGKFGKCHHSSKPVIQMTKDGKLIKIYAGAAVASRELNIGKSNISAVCKNKRKTAGNYKWKFYV